MRKYNKLIGMVVDNGIIIGVEEYFDLSTERVEYAYIIKTDKIEYGVNCDLLLN